MKNYWWIVELIIIIAIAITVSLLITKAIWNSDLPMWLKVFLSR